MKFVNLKSNAIATIWISQIYPLQSIPSKFLENGIYTLFKWVLDPLTLNFWEKNGFYVFLQLNDFKVDRTVKIYFISRRLNIAKCEVLVSSNLSNLKEPN